MGDLMIMLPGGGSLSLPQACALVELVDRFGRDRCHWYLNDCGCCVTLHGPDCAYVINRDGDETLFPSSGR